MTTKKSTPAPISINELHLHIDNKLVVDTILGVEHRIRQLLERIEHNMAKSPEIQAMQDAVSAALDDVANDIAVLVARSTGLSTEDKEALNAITEKAKAVAAIFDSTGGTGGV